MKLFASRSKQGFTLIELLVVIAIIAILAAILFPVFGRARENARRSSCQSNLKQIGLGMMQYIQDYDEKYPLRRGASSSTPLAANAPATHMWYGSINPYIKSNQLFQCPSDATSGSSDTSAGEYSDYFYNSLLHNKSQARLTATASTIMLGDIGTIATGSANSDREDFKMTDGCGNDSEAEVCQTPPAAAYPVGGLALIDNDAAGRVPAAQRHLEGANYAFADGHVKWLKGNSTQRSASILNGNTPADQANGRATFGL
jgi:prepilin-type N-terminal cleavage/methylation domain-containing protein/prepilin-type processing-associated H-X9-DG protein